MNDTNVATKEDIKMILEAVNQGFKEVDERFKQVDERFKKIDKQFEAVTADIEESRSYSGVLIEDLEERVLGCKKDQVSLHENKLDNHEVRITDLELAA